MWAKTLQNPAPQSTGTNHSTPWPASFPVCYFPAHQDWSFEFASREYVKHLRCTRSAQTMIIRVYRAHTNIHSNMQSSKASIVWAFDWFVRGRLCTFHDPRCWLIVEGMFHHICLRFHLWILSLLQGFLPLYELFGASDSSFSFSRTSI